jgi:hypothetical protein
MRSRLFLAGVLTLTFALPLAVPSVFGQDGPPQSTPPAGQAAPGAGARRPMPKPTNLKVLPKDIAPEELMKIMRGYAGALGVECNFCHAAGPQPRHLDFASDAKPEKASARVMIAMTHSINEQYMSQIHDPDATPEDKHVTCGTCHRGHSMPEHFTPPEQHHGPPQGAPATQPPPQ